MKSEIFVKELESLCEQTGYTIRRERGSFRGDSCVMEGDKLILINKNRPYEAQIGVLVRVLRNNGLEEVYVKPAVRKRIKELWDRIDSMEKKIAKEEQAE
ncbi:MAG: hypothetical protein WD315_02855 [Balneolaceae bacterium]